MKTYICTCGTSIATKKRINLDRFIDIPLSGWDEKKEQIDAVKRQIEDGLKNVSPQSDLDDTSAEIKSLVKMGLEKNDQVILITSDTIDGKLCGEAVKKFLITMGLSTEGSVQVKAIEGLQASDGVRFKKEGLKNLLNYLVKLEYQDVIFNLTGGYKSVAPYLSLMGMVFNKPVKYIHENSSDVLTLPGVPLILDDSLILRIEDKLQKMEEETYISEEEWQRGIDYHDRRFDCLVEFENGEVTQSGIGLLFWERFKKDYPAELERDVRPASEKENKLSSQGIKHHGTDKIKSIADKLLQSPYVKGVLKSCNFEPQAKKPVRALLPQQAKVHLQREKDEVCIVTDIQSDAGYSFLIETTARTEDENKRIADILNRKYFS